MIYAKWCINGIKSMKHLVFFFALISFSCFQIFFQIEKEDVNESVKEEARADSEVRILKMLQNKMAEAKEK